MNSYECYKYALETGRVCDEMESVIASNPFALLLYAKNVIKKPFLLFENTILDIDIFSPLISESEIYCLKNSYRYISEKHRISLDENISKRISEKSFGA